MNFSPQRCRSYLQQRTLVNSSSVATTNAYQEKIEFFCRIKKPFNAKKSLSSKTKFFVPNLILKMAEQPKDSKGPVPAPVDVYDEEFYNNLKIAKSLINQISHKGDKAICKKWIGKLVKMKSDDPAVKKNRNAFFKYMLSVMEKAVKDSAYKIEGGNTTTDDNHYMCKWSNDKRTYVAAKPLPGLGTLVYLAVAREPSLGWDHP